MPCRMCENERDLVETKLILRVVKGDVSEDATISELDLKLAGRVPSEHFFPLEQVRDNGEEIGQLYDDVSGKSCHQNLYEMDERKISDGVN